MNFDRPVTDLIRSRTSWRSYTGQPVSPDQANCLTAGFSGVTGPLPGPQPRFALVDVAEAEQWRVRKFGTYGFIRGARSFMVGAVEPGEGSLENFAFALEALILKATELDLGTCWLGGSLDRKAFGEMIKLQSSEVVPAISPVGPKRSRRTLTGAAIRLGAGSARRKPWSALFFDGRHGAPLAEERAGEYGLPLEMMRLGPSASNKQPWRVVRESDGRRLHLLLERTPGYARATSIDLQRLDMGIAMCHFELAARDAGLDGRWEVGDPPDVGPVPERTEYRVSWIAD